MIANIKINCQVMTLLFGLNKKEEVRKWTAVEDNQDKIFMELIKNTTNEIFHGWQKSGTEKRKTSQKITKKNS